MRAAVKGIRRRGPKQIVVAVPVGASSTVALLEAEADRVVCPSTPPNFMAVGMWYEQFDQTGDQEVIALLQKAHKG